MKKSLIALTTIFALFSFNAGATNIGVLDVKKILKESTAMNFIQNKITKKQKEYQKQVDKKQKSLEKAQKKLESKKNILSKAALNKEIKAFEKKVAGLKKLVDRKQNSLQKASANGMSKVNDKIKDIIAEISQEKGIDIIIPSTQALFYKDELDISAEVLARLNKKITKVKVRFE